jgi:hypothetical protein
MTHGYDRPLYVLPFDDRGSFEAGIFGWKGALTPDETALIAATKQVIYDGFKIAVGAGCTGRKQASWWTSSSVPPYFAARQNRAT